MRVFDSANVLGRRLSASGALFLGVTGLTCLGILEFSTAHDDLHGRDLINHIYVGLAY
ncbi:MAG TPA: hypothetical protein VNZ53_43390 [Steroidobacteraceae bacterium]|jgi:hypothetical protein|nr:hypothetical protein [Steroidobacteraceae bacterium]